MRNLLNLTSWILLFLFAPFTLLILLSQNTVPGDLFYPVKRGLEGIVLAAASASPATRVAFRTDLTERRFKEAEKLLLAKADVSALDTFILEVQSTQEEVDALSGTLQKSQATEKLIAKIDDYQVKLTQIQTQTQQKSFSTPGVMPSPLQASPFSAQRSAAPTTPSQSQPQEEPAATFNQQADGQSGQTQTAGSSGQFPSSEPQVPQVPSQQPQIVSQRIENTKIELERIKKDLEEKKERHKEEKEEKREEWEKRSERNGRNRQEE